MKQLILINLYIIRDQLGHAISLLGDQRQWTPLKNILFPPCILLRSRILTSFQSLHDDSQPGLAFSAHIIQQQKKTWAEKQKGAWQTTSFCWLLLSHLFQLCVYKLQRRFTRAPATPLPLLKDAVSGQISNFSILFYSFMCNSLNSLVKSKTGEGENDKEGRAAGDGEESRKLTSLLVRNLRFRLSPLPLRIRWPPLCKPLSLSPLSFAFITLNSNCHVQGCFFSFCLDETC